MLPIATPRLTLRPLRPEDAQPIANLVGNWNVVRWLAIAPFPYSIADAEAFITDTFARGADGVSVTAAIARDDQLIGVIGLDPGSRGLNLGYWLGEPFWGNGYVTEAALALVTKAFGQTALTELMAGYFEGNAPSARVLAKLGFEPRGKRPMLCRSQNRELPHVNLILTRTRYRTLHP